MNGDPISGSSFKFDDEEDNGEVAKISGSSFVFDDGEESSDEDLNVTDVAPVQRKWEEGDGGQVTLPEGQTNEWGGNLRNEGRRIHFRHGKDKKVNGYSTTSSSIRQDENGDFVVFPTIIDGAPYGEDMAFLHYKQTGEHWGKAKDFESAKKIAQSVHDRHQEMNGKAWNDYIHENWDKMSEDITKDPGMDVEHRLRTDPSSVTPRERVLFGRYENSEDLPGQIASDAGLEMWKVKRIAESGKSDEEKAALYSYALQAKESSGASDISKRAGEDFNSWCKRNDINQKHVTPRMYKAAKTYFEYLAPIEGSGEKTEPIERREDEKKDGNGRSPTAVEYIKGTILAPAAGVADVVTSGVRGIGTLLGGHDTENYSVVDRVAAKGEDSDFVKNIKEGVGDYEGGVAHGVVDFVRSLPDGIVNTANRFSEWLDSRTKTTLEGAPIWTYVNNSIRGVTSFAYGGSSMIPLAGTDAYQRTYDTARSNGLSEGRAKDLALGSAGFNAILTGAFYYGPWKKFLNGSGANNVAVGAFVNPANRSFSGIVNALSNKALASHIKRTIPAATAEAFTIIGAQSFGNNITEQAASGVANEDIDFKKAGIVALEEGAKSIPVSVVMGAVGAAKVRHMVREQYHKGVVDSLYTDGGTAGTGAERIAIGETSGAKAERAFNPRAVMQNVVNFPEGNLEAAKAVKEGRSVTPEMIDRMGLPQDMPVSEINRYFKLCDSVVGGDFAGKLDNYLNRKSIESQQAKGGGNDPTLSPSPEGKTSETPAQESAPVETKGPSTDIVTRFRNKNTKLADGLRGLGVEPVPFNIPTNDNGEMDFTTVKLDDGQEVQVMFDPDSKVSVTSLDDGTFTVQSTVSPDVNWSARSLEEALECANSIAMCNQMEAISSEANGQQEVASPETANAPVPEEQPEAASPEETKAFDKDQFGAMVASRVSAETALGTKPLTDEQFLAVVEEMKAIAPEGVDATELVTQAEIELRKRAVDAGIAKAEKPVEQKSEKDGGKDAPDLFSVIESESDKDSAESGELTVKSDSYYEGHREEAASDRRRAVSALSSLKKIYNPKDNKGVIRQQGYVGEGKKFPTMAALKERIDELDEFTKKYREDGESKKSFDKRMSAVSQEKLNAVEIPDVLVNPRGAKKKRIDASNVSSVLSYLADKNHNNRSLGKAVDLVTKALPQAVGADGTRDKLKAAIAEAAPRLAKMKEAQKVGNIAKAKAAERMKVSEGQIDRYIDEGRGGLAFKMWAFGGGRVLSEPPVYGAGHAKAGLYQSGYEGSEELNAVMNGRSTAERNAIREILFGTERGEKQVGNEEMVSTLFNQATNESHADDVAGTNANPYENDYGKLISDTLKAVQEFKDWREEGAKSAEDEYYARQEEAERANTVEISDEPYHIDELEQGLVADAVYDEAAGFIAKFSKESPEIMMFDKENLANAEPGDVIYFDHQDEVTFLLESFNPETGELRLADESTFADRVFIVTDNTVREVKEEINGREDETGADDDIVGDEEGERYDVSEDDLPPPDIDEREPEQRKPARTKPALSPRGNGRESGLDRVRKYDTIVNPDPKSPDYQKAVADIMAGHAVSAVDPSIVKSDNGTPIPVTALRIENDTDAAILFQNFLYDPKVEHAKVMYIGAEGEVLGIKSLGFGKVGSAQWNADEVTSGITPDCKKVIVSHNHPSGIPHPSNDDISATEAIKSTVANSHPGVEVDHIITDTDRFYSMNAGRETRAEIVENNGANVVPIDHRVTADAGSIERIVAPLMSPEMPKASYIVGISGGLGAKGGNKIVSVAMIPSDGSGVRNLLDNGMPGSRMFAIAVGEEGLPNLDDLLSALDSRGEKTAVVNGVVKKVPDGHIKYVYKNGKLSGFGSADRAKAVELLKAPPKPVPAKTSAAKDPRIVATADEIAEYDRIAEEIGARDSGDVLAVLDSALSEGDVADRSFLASELYSHLDMMRDDLADDEIEHPKYDALMKKRVEGAEKVSDTELKNALKSDRDDFKRKIAKFEKMVDAFAANKSQGDSKNEPEQPEAPKSSLRSRIPENETPAQTERRLAFDKVGENEGAFFTLDNGYVWYHGYNKKHNPVVGKKQGRRGQSYDEHLLQSLGWAWNGGRGTPWQDRKAFAIPVADIPKGSTILDKVDESEGATQRAIDKGRAEYEARAAMTPEQKAAERSAAAQSVREDRWKAEKKSEDELKKQEDELFSDSNIDWDNLAEDTDEVWPENGGIPGIYTGSAADYANKGEDGRITNGPSLLKVGTGEGSQVYGWALYGSNRRGVAERYANSEAAHKGTPGVVRKNGRPASGEVEETVSSYLKYASSSFDDAMPSKSEIVDDALMRMREFSDNETVSKAIKELETNSDQWTVERSSGNIYEQTFFTNREPGDESHLLKWYEPVSKENIERINDNIGPYDLNSYDEIDKVVAGDGTHYFWSGVKMFVEGKPHELTGGEFYNLLSKRLGSPKAASEFLARADIDGVKYPVDSYGGKGVKDGDKVGWNYASFRDDNIRVDHKWTDGVQVYEPTDETPRKMTQLDKVFNVLADRATDALRSGEVTTFDEFKGYIDQKFGANAPKVARFLPSVYNAVRQDISPDISARMTPEVEVKNAAREAAGLPDRGKDGIGHRVPHVTMEHLVPTPEKVVTDESFNHGLDADQQIGVNLALGAISKPNGSFLLADGTGFGKTRQELAIAESYRRANPGAKILILSENEALLANEFRRDANAMGINLDNFDKGTYNGLAMKKFHLNKGNGEQYQADVFWDGTWDLVMLDEAHNLANAGSLRAQAFMSLPKKHVVFATATPMDRNTDAAYFLSTLNECDPNVLAKTLGYELVNEYDENRKMDIVIPRELQGQDKDSIRKRIMLERDKAIAAGKMIRREYPFLGSISSHRHEMSEAHGENERAVAEFYQNEIRRTRTAKKIWRKGINYYKGGLPKGVPPTRTNIPVRSPEEWEGIVGRKVKELQDSMYRSVDVLNEHYKAEQAANMALDIVKKNPNARVIIVGQQVGDQHLETGGIDPATGETKIKLKGMEVGLVESRIKGGKPKSKFTVKASLKVVDDALAENGFTDVAHIYAGKDRGKERDDFVSQRKPILVMTDASGGTGINLDDTTGEHPTYMIILTQNYSAKKIMQLLGRISRKNTASLANAIILTNDSFSEAHHNSVTDRKIGVLQAIQGGADADTNLDADISDESSPEEVEFEEPVEYDTVRDEIDDVADRIFSEPTEDAVRDVMSTLAMADVLPTKRVSGLSNKRLAEKIANEADPDSIPAFSLLVRRAMGLEGKFDGTLPSFFANVKKVKYEFIPDLCSKVWERVMNDLKTEKGRKIWTEQSPEKILHRIAGWEADDLFRQIGRQKELPILDAPAVNQAGEAKGTLLDTKGNGDRLIPLVEGDDDYRFTRRRDSQREILKRVLERVSDEKAKFLTDIVNAMAVTEGESMSARNWKDREVKKNGKKDILTPKVLEELSRHYPDIPLGQLEGRARELMANMDKILHGWFMRGEEVKPTYDAFALNGDDFNRMYESSPEGIINALEMHGNSLAADIVSLAEDGLTDTAIAKRLADLYPTRLVDQGFVTTELKRIKERYHWVDTRKALSLYGDEVESELVFASDRMKKKQEASRSMEIARMLNRGATVSGGKLGLRDKVSQQGLALEFPKQEIPEPKKESSYDEKLADVIRVYDKTMDQQTAVAYASDLFGWSPEKTLGEIKKIDRSPMARAANISNRELSANLTNAPAMRNVKRESIPYEEKRANVLDMYFNKGGEEAAIELARELYGWSEQLTKSELALAQKMRDADGRITEGRFSKLVGAPGEKKVVGKDVGVNNGETDLVDGVAVDSDWNIDRMFRELKKRGMSDSEAAAAIDRWIDRKFSENRDDVEFLGNGEVEYSGETEGEREQMRELAKKHGNNISKMREALKARGYSEKTANKKIARWLKRDWKPEPPDGGPGGGPGIRSRGGQYEFVFGEATEDEASYYHDLAMDEWRTSRGMNPLRPYEKETLSDLESAVKRERTNPYEAKSLINRMIENPNFALNSVQQALLISHIDEMKRSYDHAWTSRISAEENGNQGLAEHWQRVMNEMRPDIDRAMQANRKFGNIWGKAGRARQIGIKNDYSFTRLVTDAQKAKGDVPLTDDERAAFDVLAKNIRKLEGAITAQHLKDIDELLSSYVRDSLGKAHKAVQTKLLDEKGREEIDRLYRNALLQLQFHGKTHGSLFSAIPGAKKYLNAIQRYHLAMGDIYNPDGTPNEKMALDAIIRDLSSVGIEADEYSVRQALTDMGKSTVPDQSIIERDRRELNRQHFVEQQMAYMMRYGEMPPVTAYQRDKDSVTFREMKKRRNKLIKELGLDADKEAGKLKSALESSKTRIRNAMEDMLIHIPREMVSDDFLAELQGHGVDVTSIGTDLTKMVKDKREPLSDEEKLGLMECAKKLSEIYRDAYPKTEDELHEEAVLKAMRSLNKRIEEWDEKYRRAQGLDFAKEPKAPGVSDPRIDALKSVLDLKKQAWQSLKDAFFPEGTADEIERQIQARMKGLSKKIDEYDLRLKEYENADTYEKRVAALKSKPRKDPLRTPEIAALERQRDELKAQVKEKMRELEDSVKSPLVKGFRKLDDAVSFSRLLRTSMDISAMFTQGGVMSISHPVNAAKALFNAIKALSPDKCAEVNGYLVNDPWFKEFVEAGGHVYGGIDHPEAFRGVDRSVLMKIPGVGPAVAASERAFTTYLNCFARSMYEGLASTGFGTEGPNEFQRKQLAKFVNHALGYGYDSRGGGMGRVVDFALFAPRLLIGSAKMAFATDVWLSPYVSGKWIDGSRAKERNQVARRVGKSWIKGIALAIAVQCLLKLLLDDEGRSDKESWEEFFKPGTNEFLRPVKGNSHIMVGLHKVARFWNLLGKLVNAERGDDGKIQRGRGFGDMLQREIRKAASPALGTMWDAWDGEDILGRRIDWMKSSLADVEEKTPDISGWRHVVENTVVPLFVADLFSSYRHGGAKEAAAEFIPLITGMSIQHYRPDDKFDKAVKQGKDANSIIKDASDVGDRETVEEMKRKLSAKDSDTGITRGRVVNEASEVQKSMNKIDREKKKLEEELNRMRKFHDQTADGSDARVRYENAIIKLRGKMDELKAKREEVLERAKRFKWYGVDKWKE